MRGLCGHRGAVVGGEGEKVSRVTFLPPKKPRPAIVRRLEVRNDLGDPKGRPFCPTLDYRELLSPETLKRLEERSL